MSAQLTQPLFDVLAALASGPQHGYAVMLSIETQYKGKYRPSPGVVYSNIQRGVDAGWIEEVAVATGTDARRRHFRLTQFGVQALKEHAQSMKEVADHTLTILNGVKSC